VTDGQTDGQNYDSQERTSIAAWCGKNANLTLLVWQTIWIGLQCNL